MKVITPVSTEPITLAEAKAHLITNPDTTDDTLITALISAAREYCENYTSRALATQTLEMYLDRFPCSHEIELLKPPLQSVTSVTYTDSAGTTTTMTANTDYIVDADSMMGRIVLPYGKLWPSFTPYSANPIKIRYVAGYTVLPKLIKQAMLLLIGHWYANREAVMTATYGTTEVRGNIELSVKSLLSMYRVRWY